MRPPRSILSASTRNAPDADVPYPFDKQRKEPLGGEGVR